MNEQNENESVGENWDVEDLLRQVQLAAPSRELDRKIAGLFRPRWRAFIGPLSGFAAGIVVTATVLGRFRPAVEHPAAPTVSPAMPSVQEAPAGRPGYLIENRQVHTLADGEVNGWPVRLERSQSHLVVWKRDEGGALWRAEVALPEQMQLRPVQRF